MPIDTFEDHYSIAKKHALNAIQHNQNVVLWGTGCNGKSHLTWELIGNDLLSLSNYNHLYQGDLIPSDSNKLLWLECINVSYPITELKHLSYVFINMDGFVYPDCKYDHVYYSKLRSGRDCY